MFERGKERHIPRKEEQDEKIIDFSFYGADGLGFSNTGDGRLGRFRE